MEDRVLPFVLVAPPVHFLLYYTVCQHCFFISTGLPPEPPVTTSKGRGYVKTVYYKGTCAIN